MLKKGTLSLKSVFFNPLSIKQSTHLTYLVIEIEKRAVESESAATGKWGQIEQQGISAPEVCF